MVLDWSNNDCRPNTIHNTNTWWVGGNGAYETILLLLPYYCCYWYNTAQTGILWILLESYYYYCHITATTCILLILLVLHCYHYHTDVTTGILLLPLAKCWYHWHIVPATIHTTASTSKLLQQRKELQQSACCEEHLHPQDCISFQNSAIPSSKADCPIFILSSVVDVTINFASIKPSIMIKT